MPGSPENEILAPCQACVPEIFTWRLGVCLPRLLHIKQSIHVLKILNNLSRSYTTTYSLVQTEKTPTVALKAKARQVIIMQ